MLGSYTVAIMVCLPQIRLLEQLSYLKLPWIQASVSEVDGERLLILYSTGFFKMFIETV